MAFTHNITLSWTGAGSALSHSNSYSSTSERNIDEPIPVGTDEEVALVLDVSEIKSIYIVSDQNLTLETNNAGTPADTIVLLAGVPYIWHTGSYYTNLLATDITALFLTNASGEIANFKLRVVFDSTP